jgi:drug/metabolite transporter (DMT)-like permease
VSQHFDWSAWAIIVVLAAISTLRAYAIWFGKASRSYLHPKSSDEGTSDIRYRIGASYVPIAGLFIALAVLTLARHGTQQIKSHALRAIVFIPFYLGCTVFALSAVFVVSIQFFRAPKFLIPPSLRRE